MRAADCMQLSIVKGTIGSPDDLMSTVYRLTSCTITSEDTIESHKALGGPVPSDPSASFLLPVEPLYGGFRDFTGPDLSRCRRLELTGWRSYDRRGRPSGTWAKYWLYYVGGGTLPMHSHRFCTSADV